MITKKKKNKNNGHIIKYASKYASKYKPNIKQKEYTKKNIDIFKHTYPLKENKLYITNGFNRNTRKRSDDYKSSLRLKDTKKKRHMQHGGSTITVLPRKYIKDTFDKIKLEHYLDIIRFTVKKYRIINYKYKTYKEDIGKLDAFFNNIISNYSIVVTVDSLADIEYKGLLKIMLGLIYIRLNKCIVNYSPEELLQVLDTFKPHRGYWKKKYNTLTLKSIRTFFAKSLSPIEELRQYTPIIQAIKPLIFPNIHSQSYKDPKGIIIEMIDACRKNLKEGKKKLTNTEFQIAQSAFNDMKNTMQIEDKRAEMSKQTEFMKEKVARRNAFKELDLNGRPLNNSTLTFIANVNQRLYEINESSRNDETCIDASASIMCCISYIKKFIQVNMKTIDDKDLQETLTNANKHLKSIYPNKIIDLLQSSLAPPSPAPTSEEVAKQQAQQIQTLIADIISLLQNTNSVINFVNYQFMYYPTTYNNLHDNIYKIYNNLDKMIPNVYNTPLYDTETRKFESLMTTFTKFLLNYQKYISI